jgi:KipI family sensor histidine kinase inhibitor
MSDTMFQRLGDRAIRFARPPVPARAIVKAVRDWPGVIDVVVAAEDVAAYFVDPVGALREVEVRIRALGQLSDIDEPVREHVLQVRYDGIDLDEVAKATALSRDDVIAAHVGATYTVETIGFAPGFAYLSGLDPRLELARRATPRPRVAAGSVAIAGRQSAVYPFDSPGGWHLLGSVVGVTMFGERGALLALGDRVRFEVAT